MFVSVGTENVIEPALVIDNTFITIVSESSHPFALNAVTVML